MEQYPSFKAGWGALSSLGRETTSPDGVILSPKMCHCMQPGSNYEIKYISPQGFVRSRHIGHHSTISSGVCSTGVDCTLQLCGLLTKC